MTRRRLDERAGRYGPPTDEGFITMQVQVRYYAAAKAATGVAEETRDLPAGATIGAFLTDLGGSSPAVFARCSFIVNGTATTDRARVLNEGDRLDVLPPFAGG
ncbi:MULTISPECIES: MoaD/ThiS family protein [Cryobacterium]|nr:MULTISPECIES: MoaD/ThiS family protein [Cryobacterium]